MNKNLTPNEINQWLESVWGQRAQGLPVPEFDPIRPPSPAEIQYLLDHNPYLQLINTEIQPITEVQAELITAQTGWTIHNYNNQALSTSRFIYPTDNNATDGTIIKQAFDTAIEMVLVAMQKGWPGIEIVAGQRLMQWATWAFAAEQNYPTQGFEPTRQEEEKRQRVRQQFNAELISQRNLGLSRN